MSVWDLTKLGVDTNSIESYYIKWDKLYITFKDEDTEDLVTYPNIVEVESYDNINGHEWVKHPMSVKASFKIAETTE
jgi:hypothetical protein